MDMYFILYKKKDTETTEAAHLESVWLINTQVGCNFIKTVLTDL